MLDDPSDAETVPSRQRERSERSTKRLLDAAGEILVEGGYTAMTLAAVGARAGYSRGLVSARFGSKDRLLEALIDRITTGWSHRNVLPRTEGKPGRQRLVILLDAIRVQAERDPRALRVLYALMFEALGPVPELREKFIELHVAMREDIARMVRLGLRDGSVTAGVSPKREGELVVAGLRGIAYQWSLDPVGFAPAPALRYLTSTVEERLRPR